MWPCSVSPGLMANCRWICSIDILLQHIIWGGGVPKAFLRNILPPSPSRICYLAGHPLQSELQAEGEGRDCGHPAAASEGGAERPPSRDWWRPVQWSKGGGEFLADWGWENSHCALGEGNGKGFNMSVPDLINYSCQFSDVLVFFPRSLK